MDRLVAPPKTPLYRALRQCVARYVRTTRALLGGLCVLCLGIVALSGAALTLRFSPSSNEAALSLQQLQDQVPYGWLFRGVHIAASNTLVGFMLAHLAGNYVRKGGQSTRAAWKTGILGCFVVFTAAWSGGILPFDDRGQASAKISAAIAQQIPVLGAPILWMLQPSPVARLFGVHLVAGASLALVAWLHVGSDRLRRLNPFRFWIDSQESVSTRTTTIITRCAWLFVTMVIVLASPIAVSLRIDAACSPTWYFWPVYELVRLFPTTMGSYAGASVAVLLFLLLVVAALVAPILPRKRA